MSDGGDGTGRQPWPTTWRACDGDCHNLRDKKSCLYNLLNNQTPSAFAYRCGRCLAIEKEACRYAASARPLTACGQLEQQKQIRCDHVDQNLAHHRQIRRDLYYRQCGQSSARAGDSLTNPTK